MGRLEKIVVLTVVFLIAVILGISLHEREEAGGPLADGPEITAPGAAEDPVVAARTGDDDRGRLLESPRITAPVEATDARDEARSRPARREGSARGLLSSEARVTPPVPEPEPAAPVEGLLMRTDGLVPTPYDADLRLYTWKRGDTFAAVATAYYGDASRARLLRNANEGRAEGALKAGEQIFVPVRELEVGRSAVQPRGGAGTYVVAEGDTLSGIALRMLGDATRYMDLYEANLDVLSSPDDLALGQVLRIPE